ncbi:rhodanese-like domain-containing protein [Evansella sp. LMS18]|jgi:rhodanese-related sulfurtransferase|uniref:rhodanese-like domain-containing protein n=1 Tax=Evansella sp. LMS18 TaxID=2924033 RepID=UPI0020D1ED35|nr:rhodanese-like domain-containing protein [Evansella sp. LMS18]UTR11556.1 rhodanese-like domain-containing protein [Evansella sp. LMS18]
MNNGYEEISPEEIRKRIHKGEKLSIIDVREPQEVAEGTIPDAENIPLGELLTRLNNIDKDKEHIIVCRSGNRSGLASEWLTDRSYQVKNMTGGMLKWNEEEQDMQ